MFTLSTHYSGGINGMHLCFAVLMYICESCNVISQGGPIESLSCIYLLHIPKKILNKIKTKKGDYMKAIATKHILNVFTFLLYLSKLLFQLDISLFYLTCIYLYI